MASLDVDYSLYLVTDSTRAILGDRDLASVVRSAVEGGATVVQLRDKTSETAQLIRVAKGLQQVTRSEGVPLLINDRVDVALAVGADGVHLGQDDMDLASARRLLGPDAIIGVTAQSADEAIAAAEGGASYLGIGTVFATPTKEDTKAIIGPSGVRAILSALADSGHGAIPTVCIGGINASNVQRVLFQSTAPTKRLDGVAVASAIMAAENPAACASALRRLIDEPPAFASSKSPAQGPLSTSTAALLKSVPSLVARVASTRPLCHNMTNLVVQNFAANIALAVGGSPIMSSSGAEASDLAALDGSLVINMGTATAEMLGNHETALRAYNARGTPVLLDPVGAGATAVRRHAVKRLMAAGYFSVIKGNEAEIVTVLGASDDIRQHGVDGGGSGLSETDRAQAVETLAARERTVVLMTGETDLLSDGTRTFKVANGHGYLGAITGSGCALGTTIAAFLAVEREDPLLAALGGLLMYELAAERAADGRHVNGPGTFVPAFIDELARIRALTCGGDESWMEAQRVEKISVE